MTNTTASALFVGRLLQAGCAADSHRTATGSWFHQAAERDAEAKRLDRRWECAVAVARELDTPDQAVAAHRRTRLLPVLARLNLTPLEHARALRDARTGGSR